MAATGIRCFNQGATKRFLFPLIDGAASIFADGSYLSAITPLTIHCAEIRKCSQGRSSGLYFGLKSQRSLCAFASCTWFRKFLWAATQKAIMVEVWFQLVWNAEAYFRRVRMRIDYVERGRLSPMGFNWFRFPTFEVRMVYWVLLAMKIVFFLLVDTNIDFPL